MADQKNTNKRASKPAANKPAEYYIVNPAGAIHQVSKDHAYARIRVAGWRFADEHEIKAYKDAKIQRADRPIATPFAETIQDPDADQS